MMNQSSLAKDKDLAHSVPSESRSRAWFWWLTSLLLVNAALAFGYHFLDWNPAASASADAPGLVVAPHSIYVTGELKAPAPATMATPAVVAATPTTCWVWGPFNHAQAEEFLAKAQSANLPDAQLLPTPTTASHVISMGPYPNRAALDKKVTELKRMKVTDFAVTDKLTISLGIFSSETAAQNQFKALGKLGVRSAKVLRKDTVVNKTSLRFDALTDAQTPLLKALATDLGKLAPC